MPDLDDDMTLVRDAIERARSGGVLTSPVALGASVVEAGLDMLARYRAGHTSAEEARLALLEDAGRLVALAQHVQERTQQHNDEREQTP